MYPQLIDLAIAAHSEWKARLRRAISTGVFDTTPDSVRECDVCELGKWLYGSWLTSDDKDSVYYQQTVVLHARFHEVAAQVLEMAVAGRTVEAEQLLSDGSEFSDISRKLTESMRLWKEERFGVMTK